MDTAHLQWRFRSKDAAAVLAISGKMDALYEQLLRDYGLPHALHSEKLIVEVRTDYLPGRVLLQKRAAESITVPSPAIYLVPEGISDAEFLAQIVALALVQSAWDQAVEEYDLQRPTAFLQGLNVWEIGDQGLSLSVWRDDIVGWIYGTNTSEEDGAAAVRRQILDTCAAHAVRMIRPIMLGIPVYCDNADSGPLTFRVWLTTDWPMPSLQPATVVYQKNNRMTWLVDLALPMSISTVIEYAVTTYGRDKLPALVAAAGEHESWETLVPAVYGVSYEAFERGWRQHVASRAR